MSSEVVRGFRCEALPLNASPPPHRVQTPSPFLVKVKGRALLEDLSTPHSIEHYLPSGAGSAIGLDVIGGEHSRFTNLTVMRTLDMKTKVRPFSSHSRRTPNILAPRSSNLFLSEAVSLRGSCAACGPLVDASDPPHERPHPNLFPVPRGAASWTVAHGAGCTSVRSPFGPSRGSDHCRAHRWTRPSPAHPFSRRLGRSEGVALSRVDAEDFTALDTHIQNAHPRARPYQSSWSPPPSPFWKLDGFVSW